MGGKIGASDYRKYNYKYDTTTNTYTNNGTASFWLDTSASTAIGNIIYIFQGTNNYKYDTTTKTYTQNKNIPYTFFQGSAVAINNNIYLLGSYYDGTTQYHYKYNTTTNTYTKLTDVPYNFSYGAAVAIGTDIYLLGGYYSGNNNYKYDTTTNSYTKMKDIPYNFSQGSAVAIGNDIYLLGTEKGSTNYKYNIPYNVNGIIKPTNHSIYTESNSYTQTSASIVPIEDNNYTEYDENNIILNTFPIDRNGNTKIYIKSGAKLNGKEVTVDTIGWNTINILEYL